MTLVNPAARNFSTALADRPPVLQITNSGSRDDPVAVGHDRLRVQHVEREELGPLSVNLGVLGRGPHVDQVGVLPLRATGGDLSGPRRLKTHIALRSICRHRITSSLTSDHYYITI
jgi:hypothetical protein